MQVDWSRTFHPPLPLTNEPITCCFPDDWSSFFDHFPEEPYRVYRETGHTVVEFDLPGMDLPTKLTLEGNNLTVSGRIVRYQGEEEFSHTVLVPDCSDATASYKDGLLRVFLTTKTCCSKTKTIPINMS